MSAPEYIVEKGTGLQSGSRLVGLAQALCLKKPLIDAVQPFLLRFGEQGIVLDIEQVIHDEPYGLVGGHPVLGVEALQVHRKRITPQCALAPEVEIDVEI